MNNDFCSDCSQSHDCKEVYRQIGGVKGKSVAARSAGAFLLPIAGFIAGLIVSEFYLARFVTNQTARILLTLIPAVVAGAVCVLMVISINRLFGKKRNFCEYKGAQRSKQKPK